MADELNIRTVTGGPIDVNTYVLSLPGREDCVLIDPGAEEERIRAAMGNRRVAAVLLTHGHFDHILTLPAFRADGVRTYIHMADAPMLTDPALNLSGTIGRRLAPGPVDVLLAEGDVIEAAGMAFTVLHTPGHTPGGVCYAIGEHLFSGDTMFYGTYGRIDLPGGDPGAMSHSLARLLQLPPETRVYPGHGDATRIGWERERYR